MKVMTEIFLADTYAIIEIIKGSKSYKGYLDANIVTTRLNIIELYYHLLHDFDEKIADKYLVIYSKFLIPFTDNTIKRAMKFKLKNKKEKLSYVDCIVYALALELGIKFLTGDKKFENKYNVEFVK